MIFGQVETHILNLLLRLSVEEEVISLLFAADETPIEAFHLACRDLLMHAASDDDKSRIARYAENEDVFTALNF
uniref:Transcriptional regulator n=1 Tax=Panagrellus redivivus TaxID=6233 RepID=A0A7E4ZXY1_PANRE